MGKLPFAAALAAMFVLFFLQGTLVDALGWSYMSSAASAVTKIHPATYLFALAALLALAGSLTPVVRIDPLLRSWQFLFYGCVVLLLLARAVTIAMKGVTAGEQSQAIVTYATPVLAVIALVQLGARQLDMAAILIRCFFVANSLLALVEGAIGQRLVTGYIDLAGSLPGRAAALAGHPLSGAVLTGELILLLAFGPRRQVGKAWRLPELALHLVAMFAFGGRAAIALLLGALAMGGILTYRRRGEDKVGLFQRLTPVLVLLGGGVLALFPPDFVTAALERFDFTHDKSAHTRLVLFDMFGGFTRRQIWLGMPRAQLDRMLAFYHTPYGIESCWLNMIAVFGLAVTLPLMLGLTALLLRILARSDRAVPLAILYFAAVTLTSLSIGSKSLLLAQLFVMILVLGHRIEVRRPAIVPGMGADGWPRGGLGLPGAVPN